MIPLLAVVLENERLWQIAVALIAVVAGSYLGAYRGRKRQSHLEEQKYRERILAAERALEVHCIEAQGKEALINSRLSMITETQAAMSDQIKTNTTHLLESSAGVARLVENVGKLNRELGRAFGLIGQRFADSENGEAEP